MPKIIRKVVESSNFHYFIFKRIDILTRKKREIAKVEKKLLVGICFFYANSNKTTQGIDWSNLVKGQIFRLFYVAQFSVDSNHMLVWNWYKPNTSMLPPFWKTPHFIKHWASFWETQKVKQRFINNATIGPTPLFWLNPKSPCVFQKVKFIPITFYKTETTFCVLQKVM